MTTSETMNKHLAPWPEYQSHKKVRAIKVTNEEPQPSGWDVFTDDGGMTHVSTDFFNRHIPDAGTFAGGYLIKYPDGYLSWSPAEAFEMGYTRVEG